MKITYSFLLCLFGITVHAQHLERQIINTLGKTYNASGIVLQTSVGEPIVGQLMNDSVTILSQGFFTGFTKINRPVVTDPPTPVQPIPDEFSIYPNPVNNFFFVRGHVELLKEVQLYDLAGHRIFKQQINLTGIIQVQNLPSGFYIAELINKANEAIKVFKIIKLK